MKEGAKSILIAVVYMSVMISAQTVNSTESQSEQYAENLDLLSRLIHAEAGGEPFTGKIAVGNVVLNRIRSSQFANDLEGVVFQAGQFCVVREGSIAGQASQDSIDAAIAVLSGMKVVEDDVLFFYNPKTATDEWIRTREIAKVISNHNFTK